MSRKNRPHHHEPVSAVSGFDDPAGEVPVEDTLEVGATMLTEAPLADGAVSVGTVFLTDGPADPVPLGVPDGADPAGEAEIMAVEFGVVAEYDIPAAADAEAANPYTSGSYPEPAPPMTGSAGQLPEYAQEHAQEKADDMAQNVTQTAQDLAGKAQSAAGDLADKAQDAAQTVADKAKDAAQTLADKAAAAKTTAADTSKKSKGAVAGAAGTVGTGLWTVVQRSPLQAIFFIASLVWLIRNHQAAAAQPPVSVSDAAEKVGTLSGQVQVAAGNLGSQVKTSAQAGAGWFGTTLQENPLVIGAMALVAGLGLGLAVPETSYEHKTLGKTRDQLLDKATEAASDLTHKVTVVAQTAVHEAVETAKTEAKNQGLAPQDEAPAEQPPQEQTQPEQAQPQ